MPNAVNLDDDCLEHVFRYLNLTDLTNVARAHPQFVPSARLLYSLMYARKTVFINDSGIGLLIQDERIYATVPAFMEVFGDLLQKLSLDYSFAEDQNDHLWRDIEKTIFKCCSKSLTVLELKNFRANVMEEVRRPLEMVRILTLISGSMDENSIKLSNLCPNVKYLVLNSMNVRGGSIGNFQYLKSLKMIRPQTTAAQEFLKSHGFIEELRIDFDYGICSPEFLLFLSTTLIHLEMLLLDSVEFGTVDTQTHIHFKNIRNLFLETKAGARMPSNVSISFDQLNTLKLYGVDGSDMMWREFIAQSSTLTHLIFMPSGSFGKTSADDLLYIVDKLSNLMEFEISARAIFPVAVTSFLKSWQSSVRLETLILQANTSYGLEKYHDVIDADLTDIFQKTIKRTNIGKKMIISRNNLDQTKD